MLGGDLLTVIEGLAICKLIYSDYSRGVFKKLEAPLLFLVKLSYNVKIATGYINPASGRGFLLPWLGLSGYEILKMSRGYVESNLE